LKKFDLVVVGGGILGCAVASWASGLFEGKMAVVEREDRVAAHTSGRNTGVVHRPFYLDPAKKRAFAISAQASYGLWEDWAKRNGLPWSPVGTLEVAVEGEQLSVLKNYMRFAKENGMTEGETELLDPQDVAKLEPLVRCEGAILCRTDTAVDFAAFADSLMKVAMSNGVEALMGTRVVDLKEREEGVEVVLHDGGRLMAECLVNCAGGGAMDLAKMLGIARGYEDLHFRGEYWRVDEAFGRKLGHNVYSVPRHAEFPFLDPHFIVRSDGSREVGPNAVLVADPYSYQGFAKTALKSVPKLLERPILPKLRLMANPRFLSLVSQEWQSSISKSAMCERVRRFIPSLSPSLLTRRGIAGVRSSVIDEDGFVPEAIELESPHSYHVVNYNSPGATGAPAYSAYVLYKMMSGGQLDHMKRRSAGTIWDFDEVVSRFGKR
jgi:L-2-hydroxyglutarate oxidase